MINSLFGTLPSAREGGPLAEQSEQRGDGDDEHDRKSNPLLSS